MQTNNPKIERALISVSDKTGIVPFAKKLPDFDVEILSTGGTAEVLRRAGIPVVDVSAHTGFPECFDGRVKTLHPFVHGGLLYKRSVPKHLSEAEAQKVLPIDMLVVNLYPFKRTVAKPNVSDEEAIENIDIGGPAMLRSAAKNHEWVVPIVDPADYEDVLTQMRQYDGATTFALRRYLAWKAFAHTASYDSAIAHYIRPNNVPPSQTAV